MEPDEIELSNEFWQEFDEQERWQGLTEAERAEELGSPVWQWDLDKGDDDDEREIRFA